MDITITTLAVPARSRNGRIYTEAGNVTVNNSSGSGGGGSGASHFLSLNDTPDTYTGQAGKAVTVKADESGVEFTTPSSGSGGATSVSYAELTALISASGLTPGAQYLISDFATVHYFIKYDEDISAFARISGAINTGTTEPLIVTATAVNKISAEAKSTLYPTDRLLYDWNPANWLTDISFAYENTIISGWKGVIYYRHDTKQNNELPYDFRNVKFRRWKVKLAAWSSSTTYAKGDTVLYNDIAYYSLRGSNLNNTPGAAPSQWAPFNDDNYGSNPRTYLSVGSSLYNNTIWMGDPNYYQDVYTFERYNLVSEYHVINNQPAVYQYGGGITGGIGTILTGVVWYQPYDTSTIFNVRISGFYEVCTLIVNNFIDFTSGDFKWNIGNYATSQAVHCKKSFSNNNFLGGQIAALNASTFDGNTISGIVECHLAGDVSGNLIAGTLQIRSVGVFRENNQYYNTLFISYGAGRLTGCTLAVNMCNIQGECYAQDFTGATQVSGNRTNTLVRTGATTNALVYYSGTTQYIVAANA